MSYLKVIYCKKGKKIISEARAAAKRVKNEVHNPWPLKKDFNLITDNVEQWLKAQRSVK